MVTPYIELYDPNALHELLMWVQDWLPLQVQPTLDCSFRCFEINKIKPELINQKYPRVSKEVWPSQSNQPAHSFPYRLTPNSYGASFDNRKDLKLDPPLLRACMYCWVWVEKKTNKDLSLHAVWFYVHFRSKGRDLILQKCTLFQCTYMYREWHRSVPLSTFTIYIDDIPKTIMSTCQKNWVLFFSCQTWF